jgi:myo-inositol-1-phosphate synthase
LFGINPNKVKPELKEKLLQYQRECFKVLYNHFNKPQQELTSLEVLANVVNNMVAQERKQKELERQQLENASKIEVLAQEVKALKSANIDDYVSIKGYANILNIKLTNGQESSYGRKASKLYREEYSSEPQSITNQRFGKCNIYPKDILDKVFNK